MDYASLYGGDGGGPPPGVVVTPGNASAGSEGGFDYSQLGDGPPGGFDPSEPLGAAPLALAFLLPPSTDAYKALRVVTWGLCGIWGVPSNAICAFVLVRSRLTKSWTYNMILSLCVSDFIFCLHGVVLRFPGVIMEEFPYGEFACRLGMALLFIPLNVTLFSFLVAAVHRYMSIVHSQVKVAALDRKWQPLVIVCIWLAAFGMAFIYFYPGELFVSYWPDQCVVFGSSPRAVSRTLTTIAVFVPIVVVMVLYVHIYIVVRRAQRRVMTKQQGQNPDQKSKSSRRMAMILFILYIAFIAIYLPFIIFYNVIDSLGLAVQKGWFSTACLGLAVISSCNPLLYGILFKDIRAAYGSVLLCGPCCKGGKKGTVVMELTVGASSK